MVDQDQEWQFETGLFERGVATIVQGSFITLPEYAEGKQILLNFHVRDEYSDEYDIRYSIGTAGGWIITEGGRKVESTEGKRAFNERSRAGAMMKHVISDLKIPMQKRGSGKMTDASIWEGLTFEFEPRPVTFKGLREGGQDVESKIVMPVRLVSDTATAPAPTKAAAPARATAAPAPATVISDEDMGKLAEVADGKSYRALVIALKRDPVLSQNRALMEGVTNRTALQELVNSGLLKLEGDVYHLT